MSWFKQIIAHCPVCGRERVKRVKHEGDRPKDQALTVHRFVDYDWCMERAGMFGA